MGIFADLGQTIERQCPACRQVVQIVIAEENQEIAYCPCCGYSLMEPCPYTIPAAMENLDFALAAYRKGERTKADLQSALKNLDEALELSRLCIMESKDEEMHHIRRFDDGSRLYMFRGELFGVRRHPFYSTKYAVACTNGCRRGYSTRAHDSIKAALQFVRENFSRLV